MGAVSEELDRVQRKLHDSAVLWTRDELLRWLNDGYRDFLARSTSVRRFWLEDVPGRFTATHTHEWEDRYSTGTTLRFSIPMYDRTRSGTTIWEAEDLEGVGPSASLAGVSQSWERAHVETDLHFRFALPSDHERFLHVAHDDEVLLPVLTRQLDELEAGWMREPGEPRVWTAGTGKIQSFEIFQIVTQYHQSYDLDGDGTGTPRELSGLRTWRMDADPEVSNAYAYSSSADAQALRPPSYDFLPTSAVTSDFEPSFMPGAPYRFTMFERTDSPTPTSADSYATQPWEIRNASPGRILGMHLWEKLHDAVMSQTPDTKPKLDGFGWRFTIEVSGGYFVTQAWEKNQLEGATLTAGATAGTYAWEVLFGAPAQVFAWGTVRGVASADRQYLPVIRGVTNDRMVGTLRDWRSSANAISILETVIPEADLTEEDPADLIPREMLKYLRYYVWSRVFGRQGEGQNPKIAKHYFDRYGRGVAFFRKLHDVAQRDRMWARDPEAIDSRRPARVRLPAEFPRATY